MLKNLITKSIVACSLMCSSVATFASDIFVDVRSEKEYTEDHIEGHLNIVHTNILEGIKQNNISKDDNIFVYCRSGRRASIAKNTLNAAGYSNVTNLGSIENARKFLNTK